MAWWAAPSQALRALPVTIGWSDFSPVGVVSIQTPVKSAINVVSVKKRGKKRQGRLEAGGVKNRFLSSDFGFTQVIKCIKKSPMYAQSGT